MPDPTRDEKTHDEAVSPTTLRPRYEPPQVIHLTDLSAAKGVLICESGGAGGRRI